MFEKVSQVAERAATNVSRRRFLDTCARGALVAAAALGGALALSREASAGRPSGATKCPTGYRKCHQRDRIGDYFYCVPKGSRC